MCLKIVDGKIYKADRDIICYKKFKIDEVKGTLISPIVPMEYALGKTYRRLFFNGTSVNCFKRFFRFWIPELVHSVERGFHSYRTFETADQYSPYFYAVVKCRIPKGTRYILGDGNEYVSLKIKPLEIVRQPKKDWNE